MRLTRAQNVLRLAGNVQNRVAYDAPSDSLVVRGFLPSAIAASRLRRLQFPVFGGGIASITQGGVDATGLVYRFKPPNKSVTVIKAQKRRKILPNSMETCLKAKPTNVFLAVSVYFQLHSYLFIIMHLLNTTI